MNETNVINYVGGTTIQMDPVAALPFIRSTAISVIIGCKTIHPYNKNGIIAYEENDIPFFDNLVDLYCSGVHDAIIANMIHQNAMILYKFVECSVLNGSVKGLYLLAQTVKGTEPSYKLITEALNSYVDLCRRSAEAVNKELNKEQKKFIQYNEKFEQMMKEEFGS